MSKLQSVKLLPCEKPLQTLLSPTRFLKMCASQIQFFFEYTDDSILKEALLCCSNSDEYLIMWKVNHIA